METEARGDLETALADVEERRLSEFVPLVQTALGDLAYESGKLQEARGHFDKAAALWTDDLPDAASVEARSYWGLLNALTRSDPAADKQVLASVQQARKMGRLALEARCRVHLARVAFGQRRYDAALAALDGIPLEGGRTIGPELQAQVHYWHSRAMMERGDRVGAASEAELAAKLVLRLQMSLPVPERDRFVARLDIGPMIDHKAVRQPG